MENKNKKKVNWMELLSEAIEKPGRLHQCYSMFHSYSLLNMLTAASQAAARGIPIGPIAPFKKWKQLGRHVKKGEKAISMWLPINVRVKDKTAEEDESEPVFKTVFVFKPRWFFLSQTEGKEYTPPPPAGWDKQRALEKLEIEEIPYDMVDGNVQGFARGRSIAVNPLAAMPEKTTFHEVAHVLLGHTDVLSTAIPPRDKREVMAECVAYICCAVLGLNKYLEACRGYVQSWMKDGITETEAKQIIQTADTILTAGRE